VDQKMKNSDPIQYWINYCVIGDPVWCFSMWD